MSDVEAVDERQDPEVKIPYYLGVKQVQAYPEAKDGKEGYAVIYPDGYKSWSPKDVFESSYFLQGEDPTKITEDTARLFMLSATGTTICGQKLSLVTLLNRFVIASSSSLPDENDGENECEMSMHDKVSILSQTFNLLKFVLAWARNGLMTDDDEEI